MDYMKSFFYFLNDVKKYFLIAFILTILGMSASLLIPYGNQILIDKALLNNSFHYLIVSIEIIAASAIIIVLFKSITNYLLRLAGEKIWVKINQTLHKKLRNIENIFELQDGRYISYFTNDAKLYKDAYLIIFQIIPDALMIIVLFIIVSSMSVFLGILILFLVILFGLFSKKIGEKVQKLWIFKIPIPIL
jgi:ABC-type multidrug transport system fused ATPase/permease subunit